MLNLMSRYAIQFSRFSFVTPQEIDEQRKDKKKGRKARSRMTEVGQEVTIMT